MNIQLKRIEKSELKFAWLMQKIGFLDVFFKYLDSISPVLQGYKKFSKKASRVDMYWIMLNDAKVGEIWIGEKENVAYLANIFILEKYRNKGIAQSAILTAEALYPQYKVWRLDTIKQEKRNCYLYEKLGYIPTGEAKRINKRMTIIDYEKRKDD
ncbi:MAG: GNAT family N-acetyltransferase [Clostridium sp.]|nr:GNAT family N-acetyltransferase [Clostridium sp.]